MAYVGIQRAHCLGAALRRGCPGIDRALASLDEDDMVEAVLLACGGCADPQQCEVSADDGVVNLYPRCGYNSAALERDLAMLGGHHDQI